MLPPGAHIWKGTSGGRWHVHLKPHKRFSKPWSEFGEAGAAFEAAKEPWNLYCMDNDIKTSDCPVSGLFSEPSAAARTD